MMPPGTQTPLAAMQAALLAHPAVGDCAIAVRTRPDGRPAVAAYVVRLAAVPDADLYEAAGHAGGALDAIVGVTAIPYGPDGQPDAPALTALPVADASVAAEWEALVAAVPGVTLAAAVVREAHASGLSLHVDNLLAPALRPAGRRTRGAIAPHPGLPAPPRGASSTARPSLADGGELPPVGAAEPNVLADVLCRAAIGGRRARRGLTYASADGSERYQSYADLLGYAEQMLAGLRAMGLEPGARVLLLLPQHRDFLPSLWACVLGGFVPVPLATPSRYDQDGPALEALRGAWQVTRPAAILVGGATAPIAALAPAGDTCPVRHVESLRGGTAVPHHPARPDDIALLMMTSGSLPARRKPWG